MAAAAGKHAPVGVAAHVGRLPEAFCRIVEALGYSLVDGLVVDDWLQGLVGPGGVDVHPVVFLRIVGDGIVLVAHALAVAAVPALKGVEVYPRGLAPPVG